MRVLRLVGILFLSLIPGRVVAGEYCAVSEPSSVLACLESAYTERDLEKLDSLLADAQGEHRVVQDGVRLVIREVEKPQKHFQIVAWYVPQK